MKMSSTFLQEQVSEKNSENEAQENKETEEQKSTENKLEGEEFEQEEFAETEQVDTVNHPKSEKVRFSGLLVLRLKMKHKMRTLIWIQNRNQKKMSR